MSINALSSMVWEADSPWRRLVWTLPIALAIWLVAIWAFAYFMGKPRERLPEPPPIDTQVIEIPAPTPTGNTTPKVKPLPPPPVKPVTPLKPQTPAPPLAPQPAVERNSPPVQDEKPAMQSSNLKAPDMPKTPAPLRVQVPPSDTGANLTGTSGAQAIVRPMPQIPDELRQEALSASATARFHVATDGTATVELIKPTLNPRLNRLLLNTLKNWRFFPAMKDNKPVISTEDIVIQIDVK